MFEIAAAILLILAAVALAPFRPASALSVGRETVAGVWRLSPGASLLSSGGPSPPVPPQIETIAGDDAAAEKDPPAEEDDVLLVLNADGSFGPCRDADGGPPSSPRGEEFVLGGVRRGGLWDYDADAKAVVLVPDRPDGADGRNVHDVVLRGAVGRGVAAAGGDGVPDSLPAVEGGSVCVGRCFYPRSHPSFFDGPGPVVRTTDVGTFSMVQVLGSLNTGVPSDGGEDEYDGGGNDDGRDDGGRTDGDEAFDAPGYSAEDLVGRRFVLTVEPLVVRAEKDPEGFLAATAPLDLRVLPVEFHRNMTFTARGVNKILRGRYRVVRGRGRRGGGGGESRLEMEVSLFGAGRSAPGSVYR